MIRTKCTGTASKDNKQPYASPVQVPSYTYPCTIPIHQYCTIATVQYHAPATYHNQSIGTNYGNVTGSNPPYLVPNSSGNKIFKD
jgi:hypothetical protein